MNLNNGEMNVLQLVKSLEDAERMKWNINASLEDSNEALGKANFITRITQRKALQEWAQNKEQCEKDIADYSTKIEDITEEINELGYDTEDIKNIQVVLRPDSGFFYHLEQDHPWIKLLSNQERDALIIEVATDREGTYSALMDFNNDYINSLATDAERLDFIHGFLREPQETEADRSDIKESKFEPELTITRAEALPDGWKWHKWDDGSGSLRSPTGESVFAYDLSTSEYRYSGEGWNFFDGYPYETASLKEEMKNVERRISKEEHYKARLKPERKSNLLVTSERKDFVAKLSKQNPEKAKAFIEGIRGVNKEEAQNLEKVIAPILKISVSQKRSIARYQ